MRGVLVFNQLNDVIFLSADDDLKKFIKKKAVENGMAQAHAADASSDWEELDTNMVVQLFSPLVASQRFMLGQIGNAYQAIHCEDGFCFVFEQYREFIYMAINGDKAEKELFLHHKLAILHRIITFFYGPVMEEVHPDKPAERERRWGLIDQMLQTWCRLYLTEQCFLVEAVERLYVNQRLNTECIELLESALRSLQSAGEKTSSHSFLLVNCKLLALFSSKNASELAMSDILLLTLLVNTAFPGGHSPQLPSSPPAVQKSLRPFVPLSGPMQSLRIGAQKLPPQETEKQDKSQSSESASEGTSINSSSSLSNTLPDGSSPYPRLLDPDQSMPMQPDFMKVILEAASGDAVPAVTSPSPPPPMEDEPLDDVLSKRSSSSLHSPDWVNVPSQGSKSPSNRSSTISSEPVSLVDWPGVRNADDDEVKVFTVLLRNSRSKYAPHLVHCIPIMNGTVMVILNEISKSSHASILTSILSSVRQLLIQTMKHSASRSSITSEVFSSLDVSLKKLNEISRMYKGVFVIERIISDIGTRWAGLKNMDFLSELASSPDVHPRLERTLTHISLRTKELFRLLFLSPRQMSPEVSSIIAQIQENLRQHLLDYRDYLVIKSQRNLAITTYLEDFPGLVHFIYIDRTTDQMTAPSIHIGIQTDDEENDIGRHHKEKLKAYVWDIVQRTQDKLKAGYTSMTAREGDYFVSYFLWFEDPMGNQLAVKEPFKGFETSQPGILTGNFYRRLLHECFQSGASAQRPIHCYELLCLHVGLVPAQHVYSHCQRLAAMLWETSEGAKTPLTLL